MQNYRQGLDSIEENRRGSDLLLPVCQARDAADIALTTAIRSLML